MDLFAYVVVARANGHDPGIIHIFTHYNSRVLLSPGLEEFEDSLHVALGGGT